MIKMDIKNFLIDIFGQVVDAPIEDLARNNTNTVVTLEFNVIDNQIQSEDDVYVVEIKKGRLNSSLMRAIMLYTEILNELSSRESFIIPKTVVVYEQGAWGNNKWITWFADESFKSEKYM